MKSVSFKFWFSILFGLLWAAFSIWFSQPWLSDLEDVFPRPFAIYIVSALAVLPGFVTMFFMMSVWLDKRPELYALFNEPITIIIAAFNEEHGIVETLTSIAASSYQGDMTVIVSDDGSTDKTVEKVNEFINAYNYPGINFKLITNEKNRGKASVLNDALKQTETDIVITVDADCTLDNLAIDNLVSRYMEDPSHTAAVAGTVLVKNHRQNLMTKIQALDYFYGISVTKRVQSLFQATSVAQGAFSLYSKKVLDAVGGWLPVVGEDIVLSWAMIAAGHRIGHAENAYGFTNVPTSLPQLIKQRRRWAMGLFEALWNVPSIVKCGNYFYATLLINILFIFIDFAYIFILIPGIVLAFFGCFLLASPWLLLVALLGLGMNAIVFNINSKTLHNMAYEYTTDVAQKPWYEQGFTFSLYAIFYSFLIQFSCILGYIRVLSFQKKTWGTK